MDFDYGEIEGYRSVYAQALIQLRKDIASPVQQFMFSPEGKRGTPRLVDWPLAIISHLTALERDKGDFEESLRVPSLSFAVSLWMENRLRSFGLEHREPRDSVQRYVNDAIQLRLDMIYGQGDPLLAAVCACEFPHTVTGFTRNVGLGAGKADEIAEMILGDAKPLARLARNLFALDHPASARSMFRPTPHFLEQLNTGDYRYENTI